MPFATPTLPKPHYPSKIANTLASLVKGRWIDGKAQTVALLLSACDMPTLFMMQTFLPSRRRDCSAIFHSEPTLPKPHYPSKIANTLATLVKGRWIDGKAQTVALLLSACDMPTLFILQTFLPSRRRDCLPLHRILPFPQSSQKYNHPLLRTTFFHPLSKVRCCPTNSTIGSL